MSTAATTSPARLRPALPVAVGLVAALLCAVLGPAVVNGDGLGFLKAAAAGQPFAVPGHVAMLPLLRLVGRAAGADGALALLPAARAICWAAAGLSAALFLVAARRLAGGRAALIASAGLVASSGFLEAGADVESYAPALFGLCLTLALAAARRAGESVAYAVGAGAAAALATLFHVENALFVPVAGLLAAGRAGRAGRDILVEAACFSALVGLLVATAYALAAPAGAAFPVGTINWVRGASHGFRYPLGPASPFLALYGICRTLVEAPYLVEASLGTVLVRTALGLAAATAMLLLAAHRKAAPLPRTVAVAWAVPYATVGVLFFASDSERWLFLLPLAWLVVGASADAAGSRGRRAAVGLIALVLSANLVALIPRARDASRRQRADAVTARLAAGDLVVAPGHAWDEYVGFYRPLAIENYPVVYYCGALGGCPAMAKDLAERAARVRAAGHAVWFLRGDEPAWSPGWKDLGTFGVTPYGEHGIDRLLPGRRVPVAAGVERLVSDAEAATAPR